MFAGHFDTVPAKENLPGPIRRGAVQRARRDRHEGGRRGRARAPPPTSTRPQRRSSRVALLPGEEICRRTEPVPRPVRFWGLAHAARSRSSWSRPTEIHAGCVGNLNATFASGGSVLIPPARGRRERDHTPRGAAPTRARAADVEVGGLPFREVLSLTRIGADVRTTSSPTSSRRRSTSVTRPTARRPRPRLLRAARRGARSRSSATPPGARRDRPPLVLRLREAGGWRSRRSRPGRRRRVPSAAWTRSTSGRATRTPTGATSRSRSRRSTRSRRFASS